jgi:hypothetical protein
MDPRGERILREGAIAGGLGYVAVAGLFLLLNLIEGQHALYTPAALGSALFFDVAGPADVVVAAGPVFAYNGTHLVISLLIGMGAAWMIAEAESHHELWYVVFFVFLGGFLAFVFFFGTLTVEIKGVMSWGHVVAGNVAGATATVGYLAWMHRRFPSQIEDELRG